MEVHSSVPARTDLLARVPKRNALSNHGKEMVI